MKIKKKKRNARILQKERKTERKMYKKETANIGRKQ